jgi:regulatory protein
MREIVSRDADDEEFEVGPKPAAPRPGLSLKARAVGLLSRREHSRQELERKLTPYAESPESLAAVLDALTREGWQSDARFIQGWVHRKSSEQGAARIVRDLKQHGMTAEAIATVQLDLKDSEFARAQAVWARKFSGKPTTLGQSSNVSSQETQAEYAKQGRFLASRGFSMEVIHRVLKQTRSLGENINDEGAAVEHIEVENATVLMSKTRGNVRR